MAAADLVSLRTVTGALHLVVPGLFGPLSRLDPDDLPRYPLLENLLARADREPAATGYAETLFDLFGLRRSGGTDLPTAALAYLADTGRRPEGAVFHADPVHLRPDQDRLLLFDSPVQDLTEAEAGAFVDAVNRHFAEEGWRLEAAVPGRWYLHLAHQPRLQTHPLSLVVGRNIDLFQLQGGDAALWQRYLNEIQMLFHGLPPNQRREMEGRLPVSGLWLHGGGPLPDAPSRAMQLMGEGDALLAGLAQLSGGTAENGLLRVFTDAWRAVQDADPVAWQQALAELEDVLAGLESNAELRLYPCHGQCHVLRPPHRYRLWRRRRPLGRQLQAEPDQTL